VNPLAWLRKYLDDQGRNETDKVFAEALILPDRRRTPVARFWGPP
jgi:hypothetical protein